MSFSPRKNLFDSSFHAVFLNYLFFFFYLVIAWYPVVFFWFAGGLKCWSCSFMKEGVLAFGTQLHSRIKFEAVCVLGTTRRLPALRRPSSEKFNLSVNVSAGPVSKNRLHQKCFRFPLLIVGDIGLVEKQTHVSQKHKKQKQKTPLPEKQSDFLDRIPLKPAFDDLFPF